MKKNSNFNLKEDFKVDGLGRIHISIEIREKLNINARDRFEIYKSNKNIVLQKIKTNLQKDNIKGMVRTIDELGRIILPIGLRKELNIETDNEFIGYITQEMIVLERK